MLGLALIPRYFSQLCMGAWRWSQDAFIRASQHNTVSKGVMRAPSAAAELQALLQGMSLQGSPGRLLSSASRRSMNSSQPLPSMSRVTFGGLTSSEGSRHMHAWLPKHRHAAAQAHNTLLHANRPKQPIHPELIHLPVQPCRGESIVLCLQGLVLML